MNEEEKQLPILPIKITREGSKLKLNYGNYILRLNEIDNKSQTYSGLILDKFISQVTMEMLQGQIEKNANRQAVRESLINLNVEQDLTDNVIRQIHDDLFGGK